MMAGFVIKDTDGYRIAVDPRGITSIRETHKGNVIVHHQGGYTYTNEDFLALMARVRDAVVALETR